MARITPQEFGFQFLDMVFTSGMLSEHINKSIKDQMLTKDLAGMHPLISSGKVVATIRHCSVEELKDEVFEVTIPIKVSVDIVLFGLLPESFEISVSASFKLEIQFYTPLSIYIHYEPVNPQDIKLITEAKSWLKFGKGDLENALKDEIVKGINEALMKSESDRHINLLCKIAESLASMPPAPWPHGNAAASSANTNQAGK